MKMGAMSMKLIGTVAVVEKDDAAHRAVMRVRSREAGGTGHANADVTLQIREGGGTSTPAPRSPARRRRWGRGS